MKRLALAIVILLGFALPAWADFQAGVAAYNRGDYAAAFHEKSPPVEWTQRHVAKLFGTA